MPTESAIVVVKNAVLGASLESALQAAGLKVTLHDAATDPETLPLDIAMTLIIDEQVLKPNPAAFVEAVRARPWDGLFVIMTGEAHALRSIFERSRRLAILELPFVGADLIAAIRAVWPTENGSSPA